MQGVRQAEGYMQQQISVHHRFQCCQRKEVIKFDADFIVGDVFPDLVLLQPYECGSPFASLAHAGDLDRDGTAPCQLQLCMTSLSSRKHNPEESLRDTGSPKRCVLSGSPAFVVQCFLEWLNCRHLNLLVCDL